MKWNDWILSYYRELTEEWKEHPPVEPLLPYLDPECKRVSQIFYNKYYDDVQERKLWLGINPGRYGSGITGIAFSDPQLLESRCNIPNSWDKNSELSAQFIFELIAAAGGPETFYKRVYIDAVSPVGYTKDGVNYNYYDETNFFEKIKPRLESHLRTLADRPIKNQVLIIGKGKNEAFLQKMDHPFDQIKALPHPRWIMQYRRKEKNKWIEKYLEHLL